MADYNIIADVSMHIVNMLRSRMCPEPIPSPGNIEVTSPAAQNSDYILGAYLYDIRQEGGVSRPPFVKTTGLKLQKPPKPYALYYMIYTNGSAQMGMKELDIHKVLGKTAQIMEDNGMILPKILQPWLEIEEPPIALSQAPITLEEKVRVWQAVNKPYQVSLFYKAAPVFLSSEIGMETPRVTDASFDVHVKGEDIQVR